MRRILTIDGGGIKGVFPASFLASLEAAVGQPIGTYFDLIVGTSTGGLLALGLGLGFSARQMLAFYEQYGPKIFQGSRWMRALRHVVRAKYDPTPLREALEATFGDRRLGESGTRLVIPSCNLDTGEVYLWKTAHHPRFERDYKERVVNVALATAAAPTYFPTHRLEVGTPLVDGGVWANNPLGVAAVEAVGILKWSPDDLRVLSLGCTSSPLEVRPGAMGWAYWGPKIINVFMAAQSSAALGTAQHLASDRSAVVRVCPTVGKRFGLDVVTEIPSLKGLGDSEARKHIGQLRPVFFNAPADPFQPLHRLTENGASTD
jgi:patatin-like phospholipase/acyl hydrolase